MKKDFFVESFSGEVYEKNFLEDDIRRISAEVEKSFESRDSENKVTTEPVRMFNDVDLEYKSNQAINSTYRLGGDFGNIFLGHFSGKIFGGV